MDTKERNNVKIEEREESFFESKDSCPEPENSAPNRKPKKQKINFNFDSKKFEGIEDADTELWAEAYPAVDVSLEIKRAALWLVANPTKRKSNYQKFLTGWFSRTQDSGGTKSGAKTQYKPKIRFIKANEVDHLPEWRMFMDGKIDLAKFSRMTGQYFHPNDYKSCPPPIDLDGNIIPEADIIIERPEPEAEEAEYKSVFGGFLMDCKSEMPF